MSKLLDLLSELVPQARTIGILVNPSNAITDHIIANMQEAARAKGVKLSVQKASTEGEIDAVFAALVQLQVGALVCRERSVPCGWGPAGANRGAGIAPRHSRCIAGARICLGRRPDLLWTGQ
jgi:hypothetical protein